MDLSKRRMAMVSEQIAARGVSRASVLRAMETVHREDFVPGHLEHEAYDDSPLPIGEGQTISQPFMVAFMIEALDPEPTDRVLEVGTGSGYAAAVLSLVVADVYTIERHVALAESARDRLALLGYGNVHVTHGDGTMGWPDHAPYDGIVVAAGGTEIPSPLVAQLAVGGALVIPIGPTSREQRLTRVVRTAEGTLVYDDLGAVQFVPLIGNADTVRRETPSRRGDLS